ncbi:MAG: hypothetical protein KDB02_15270 [Acidimicrobiales bacterium]|nr:hypothetical protein [Acidimicrobiales bacterium]
MPAGRLRGSAPVLAFVLIVTVVFVGLRALGMSGVANPRLSASGGTIEVGGITYQQVDLRNDAPTDVTIDGMRVGGEVGSPWPTVMETEDDLCNVRTLTPYKPRRLHPDESMTLFVRVDGGPQDVSSENGDGPAETPDSTDEARDVEVRTRTGSRLVRVERFEPLASSGVDCGVSP